MGDAKNRSADLLGHVFEYFLGEFALAEGKQGFCASVQVDRVAKHDYVLTPGRYAGLPDEEDDFDFVERFAALKAEFKSLLEEEAKLNAAIAESLAKVQMPESANSGSPRPASGRGAGGEGATQ